MPSFTPQENRILKIIHAYNQRNKTNEKALQEDPLYRRVS